MRTKLFAAFFLVICIVLTSSLIFEWYVMRDFDAYINGIEEDHRYWVLASVEGSYMKDKWNMKSLSEALHWGMMLGFDLRVKDNNGIDILNSHDIMNSLSPAMKHTMESVIHLHSINGEFKRYPLISSGRNIGWLYLRQLKKEGLLKVREEIFKQRGRNFLTIFLLIAGTGSLVIAVIFSLYLSRPIKKLRAAAERLAKGDFSIRTETAADRRYSPFAASYRDEIKSLADSFNYMAEALQKAEAMRKQLASNIAHELRTPLTIMKAQSEAMIDGIIDDKQAGLRNLRDEVEKLTMLVAGIEDLTKAETSFFSAGNYRRLDLKEFLSGIGYAISPAFHKKGLEFTIAEKGSLDVIADADKLERIINNLLSNALKYTNKGGVCIAYGKNENEFFVEIRDTGRGIPEDEIPKVFTRFYRGSDTADEGIGIGLAIVKELVDIMKGRTEVQSRAGEGATFRVWLPIKI